MKPFHRYLLFQTPGWVVVGAIAGALNAWFGLAPRIGLAMVGLVVVSDVLLYPFFRHSYEAPHQTGPESLIGERAAVVRALAPDGYVKLRGERWKARLLEPHERAEVGETVEALGLRGLTLLVRKVHG